MSSNEPPVEPFKRALSATMRAISGNREMNVTFGPEGASLRGNTARVPMPPRDLPPDQVSEIRGAAYALALYSRHHDRAVHRARMPAGSDARAIYDAAEQARVEALGAREMSGVADNLEAALSSKCKSQGYAHVTTRDEAPLAEAVRLLLREHLTGTAPPEAGRKVADLWRDWVEGKAGADLDALED
jgi:cobaltochelatase CobT